MNRSLFTLPAAAWAAARAVAIVGLLAGLLAAQTPDTAFACGGLPCPPVESPFPALAGLQRESRSCRDRLAPLAVAEKRT